MFVRPDERFNTMPWKENTKKLILNMDVPHNPKELTGVVISFLDLDQIGSRDATTKEKQHFCY